MFRIDAGRSHRYCDGLSRRSFVQLGMTGMMSLGLPDLLRARDNAGGAKKDTSVILLWLDGGPSHMDTYDMKPDAAPEYRGIWSPIKTNVPGIEVTELFPLQAKIADKFSVIRSIHHDNGDHFTGAHWMLTGRSGGVSGGANAGKNPGIGAIVAKLAGARQPGMPPDVAVPHASSVGLRPGYFGGNYLGPQYNPFETEGDPNAEKFQVRNLSVTSDMPVERLEDRRSLSAHFDHLRRDMDRSGRFDAMDRFERQAFDMISSPRAREAFDLSRETPANRERYGRNSWGQSVLLARRLAEAGTTFVSCHFGGWDHHWDLQKGMDNYLPKIDQLVSALFSDLSERGTLDRVLVVLMGEFSRTPRMNNGGNGGAPMSMGTPGRDHWGNSMSVLIGGGGVQGGRVIGSTDAKGEAPKDRPLMPGDLHKTMFHVLGIDPTTHFADLSGRPVAAVDHGEVIRELF